ncbi:MAG: hypothetical protein JKY26_01855 [Pseudomonas sp.]|nr:hypothetical protein [Pseudomonas sp.]
MKNYVSYSPLFTILYDETQPVGKIGRGTHYSIFRAVQSLDLKLEPQAQIFAQDFCVVWDEDHDDRIMDVLEELYIQNLLAPVLFIGERKSDLTVILDKKLYDDETLHSYFESQLKMIVQSQNDPWAWKIGYFDMDTGAINAASLIHDSTPRVVIYLRHIVGLWTLGLKEYKVPTCWRHEERPESQHLHPDHNLVFDDRIPF